MAAGQDEPASVVASRQLAEEAQLRRPGQHSGPARRSSPARALLAGAGEPGRSAPAR